MPFVVSTLRRPANNDLFHSRPMELKDVTSALSETMVSMPLERYYSSYRIVNWVGTCTPWEEVLKMQDYCRTRGHQISLRWC